jgi:hypothetical protein
MRRPRTKDQGRTLNAEALRREERRKEKRGKRREARDKRQEAARRL